MAVDKIRSKLNEDSLAGLLKEHYGTLKDHDPIAAKWDVIEKIIRKWKLSIDDINAPDPNLEQRYRLRKAFSEIARKYATEAEEIFSERYSIQRLEVLYEEDFEITKKEGRCRVWEGVDAEGRWNYIVTVGMGDTFPRPEDLNNYTIRIRRSSGGRFYATKESAWRFIVRHINDRPKLVKDVEAFVNYNKK